MTESVRQKKRPKHKNHNQKRKGGGGDGVGGAELVAAEDYKDFK